jgi:6-pyruvoyltetrahydropterin/6-carboxytetrahydropterin synthase
MKRKTAVYRKEYFNSAHRLHNVQFTEEENQAVFGKCNNPNYHGHNYELVVKVVGYIDEKTGFLIDMKDLSYLIKNLILKKFDHKNLNLDTEEFKNLNPTAENIAFTIWNILRKEIKEDLDLFITLYETEKNFVEYPA